MACIVCCLFLFLVCLEPKCLYAESQKRCCARRRRIVICWYDFQSKWWQLAMGIRVCRCCLNFLTTFGAFRRQTIVVCGICGPHIKSALQGLYTVKRLTDKHTLSWTQDWKNAGIFPALLMRPRWMPVLDQILSRIPFRTYVPRICSGSGDWFCQVIWCNVTVEGKPPQFQIYCSTTSPNISLELLNSAHQPMSHLNCFHIRILLVMKCLSIEPRSWIESMPPSDVLYL